jgi:hypothetical protein
VETELPDFLLNDNTDYSKINQIPILKEQKVVKQIEERKLTEEDKQEIINSQNDLFAWLYE